MNFEQVKFDQLGSVDVRGENTQRYLKEKAEGPYSTADMLSSAWKQGTIYDELAQMYDQQVQDFEDDQTWNIDEDMKADIIKNYSSLEGDYLQKAGSQREWDWRRQQIELDRKDSQEAAKYGVTGQIATLAASIADPAGWVIGTATGGAAKAAQVGRVASGVIGLGLGAGVGYGYGKLEQQANTTVSETGVLLGAAFGAVIEGGIAALAAGPRKAKMINETNDAIESTVHGKPASPEDMYFRANPDAKRSDIEKAINSRTKEIEARVGDIETPYVTAKAEAKRIKADDAVKRAADSILEGVPKPSAQMRNAASSLVKKIEQIETSFAKKMEAAEARVAAAKTTKQAEDAAKAIRALKDNKAKSIKGANKKFSDKFGFKPNTKGTYEIVKVARSEAKQADDLVAQGVKSDEAAAELKAWNAKSIQEKIDELFPEGAPRNDSVGAMKATRGREEDIINIGDEQGLSLQAESRIPDEMDTSSTVPLAFDAIKGNKVLGDSILAPFTILNTSLHKGIRALGNLMLENPQGARQGGAVAEKTVSSIMLNAGRMMRTAGGGAFVRNQAYEKFAKVRGKGLIRGHFDTAARKEFDQTIMLAIDSRAYKEALPDFMKEAVESVEAQMSEVLKQLQAAGVRGFENVKDSKHYVPKIANMANFKNAARKHDQTTVKAVMSKAYQTGGLGISKESADKLAAVRYNQMMRLHPDTNGVPRDVNTNDLINELRAQKVDEEIIEAILVKRADDEMNLDISDRAKKSLLPDLHAEVGGLRYADLVDNDLESLIEGYIREMAATVGVKKMLGASTYNEAKGIIDVEVAMAKGSGKMSDKDFKMIEREEQVLKDSLDVLYGKDLNGTTWRGTVKGMSRLRSFTGSLRLYMSGLASVPEFGRILGSNGLSVAGQMRSFSPRHISKMKHEDLKELDEIIPFNGEDWAFEPRTKRIEDFAEMDDASSKMWQIGDLALSGIQRTSQILSMQRMIQGTGEKLATRSIAYRVKAGKITEQQARDAGWIQKRSVRDGDIESIKEVNFLDELKEFMDANPKASIEGRKMFNLEAMSPEMFERLQTGINRLSMRDMQRMAVGELPLNFNNWIGATMLQFKSFVLGSVAKQLVHDVRAGDKMRSATALTLGIGLASSVVGFKSALQWAGDPSERQSLESYVSKRMTGTGGAYNAIMNSGQLSGISLMADALATLNMMPDDLIASRKNEWAGARKGFMPPVVSLGDDAIKAATGDPKAIHNLVPFTKTIGINQALTQLYKE